MKTAFLIMLTISTRNSEIWAFSADVAFGTGYKTVTLKFLPGFIAKTHKPGQSDAELQPVSFPAFKLPLLATTCLSVTCALLEHLDII